MRFKYISLAILVLLLLISCVREDGFSISEDALGYQSCSYDMECGSGRYCDEKTRLCSIDCVSSKDCVFKLSSPDEENNYECSPCGRCIPKGSKDERCVITKDIPCKSDRECVDAYKSTNYICRNDYCALKCNSDGDCKRMGRGFYCKDNEKVCYRRCFRDLDCYLHGWQYECELPGGVDKEANAKAEVGKEVFGECVLREGGVDWGNDSNPTRPAFKYQGIWGFMMNTAVRTLHVPLVNSQDTVSNNYMLVKIVQKGDQLIFYEKWCSIELKNFNDENPDWQDLAWMITPEQYTDNIPINVQRIMVVPELVKGAYMETDRLLEIRGALLENPETDPLPTHYNINDPRIIDQDRDGKPGMTNIMSGVLTGEVYNVQRWWVKFLINVVDENHLQGLLDHGSEQNIIDANPKSLIYDTESIKHPDQRHSYFRAKRMSDTASCSDVLYEAKKVKGSWLEFEWLYDPNKTPDK
ncbi:MAG: hypothetical protein ACP5KG_03945 [Myxococcota bacterium]